MYLVSILLPAFAVDREDDIPQVIKEQLKLPYDSFEVVKLANGGELGVRLNSSSLNLQDLEQLVTENRSLRNQLERCKESLRTLNHEYQLALSGPVDNKKNTKKQLKLKEDNKKLRQMLKAQLENAEKMRIEMETTIETLREEFDLLVKVESDYYRMNLGAYHTAEKGRHSQQSQRRLDQSEFDQINSKIIMSRETIFGSPFKNLNAGRDETKDKENTRRIRQALTNYLSSEQGKSDAQTFEQPSVSANRVKATFFAAPISGVLVGKFLADAFCAPGAPYAPKAMMLWGAFLGYRYYTDVRSWHYNNFVLLNFQRFPQEIQDALKAHDARYARKWLQQ